MSGSRLPQECGNGLSKAAIIAQLYERQTQIRRQTTRGSCAIAAREILAVEFPDFAIGKAVSETRENKSEARRLLVHIDQSLWVFECFDNHSYGYWLYIAMAADMGLTWSDYTEGIGIDNLANVADLPRRLRDIPGRNSRRSARDIIEAIRSRL